MIARELVALLVCPKCKQAMRFSDDALACASCRVRYRIRDGVPDFVAAEPLPQGNSRA